MKLLVVLGNVHPNSSQGVRYSNILLQIAKNVPLTLLSYNPFHVTGVEENIYLHQHNNYTVPRTRNGFKAFLIRFYKRFLRQFIFPDRYKFSIPAYKKQIEKILIAKSVDLVIIGMTPYSLYPLAKYIKELNPKIKVFVDLSDPFIDNAGNKNKLLFNRRNVKNFESKYLKFCDGVVVLNPSIKKLYDKVYKIAYKTYVIEQGFNKIAIDKIVQKQKTDILQLIYAGGLNKKFRNPFPLYEALCRTNKYKLDIYGNITSDLLPTDTSCIEHHGLIAHDALTIKYQTSDIIVFIDNAFGYQVPGKLLEVLSIGKPVLFIYNNPQSPSFFYTTEQSHVFQAKNNSAEILSVLKHIKDSNVDCVENKTVSRYEWRHLSEKYLKLLHE